MAYVLLVPELIIIWAARQHRDAKVLAEEFQIKGRPGWTKTHAFFLIMGGFTLHERGKPLRVLRWRDLRVLAGAGRIAWPDITEEEIKDRSKGDYLSKGIVVLQTTWFIVQFIARAASKLTITELEVVTLAFSTLIGVIYYLWWDKPLGAQFEAMINKCTLETDTRGPNDQPTDTFPPNGPLCVPTFYSSHEASSDRLVLGACVSVLFGAIHCIAWYDQFPSSPERWGWRISAIIVSVVPLMYFLLFMQGIVEQDSIIFIIFNESFAWGYTTSRIALLVLPLIALRALPPGGRQ